MSAWLRKLARIFGLDRRRHAAVVRAQRPGVVVGQGFRPARESSRASDCDLAAAGGTPRRRRVRALSEPCGNPRLAIALLRSQPRAFVRSTAREVSR